MSEARRIVVRKFRAAEVAVALTCVAIAGICLGAPKKQATVVSGRVADASGKPIAGAVVEWGSDHQPFAARQRVTTDAAGNYTIRLESRRNARLACSATGFAPTVGEADFKPGQHINNFTLTRPKDGFVAVGRVFDQQGKPIAGARVEALTPTRGFHSSFSMPTGGDYFSGPDRVSTTDQNGRFHVENVGPEEVMLRVTAKHYHVNDDNYRVGDQMRVVMSGSGKPGVLQGRIVEAATGEPPADLGSVRIARRHSPTLYECVDDDGRFRLPIEVTLGDKYIVYVYAKRSVSTSAQLTAVASDSQDYTTIKLPDGQPLRGQLVDAESGQPIPGAAIMYGAIEGVTYIEWGSFDKHTDGYHQFSFVQHVKSNNRGGFWFAEPTNQQGAIVVLQDGYQRLILMPEARETDPSTGEVVIRLPRESAIEGAVLKNGKPVKNASIYVSGPDSGKISHIYERVRSDADGRFRYGRLEPGTYTVHGGGFSRRATVQAGQTLNLNLGDDLGTINIHGEAPPHASITAYPKFDWEYTKLSAKANSKGKYKLRHLKPGQYQVHLDSQRSAGYLSNATLIIDVKKDNQQVDLIPTPDYNFEPRSLQQPIQR